MRSALAGLLAVALLSPAASAEDPDLAAGIRLFRAGDLEGALVALDGSARRLAADPNRRPDTATAYLYLGATYAALGQEPLAVSKFRQALQADAGLAPSADEFPPKVLRLFDQARARVEESDTLRQEAARKTGKAPWLLIGGGLVAAGGAVAVLTRERANEAPTGSFSIEPAGGALNDVTVMTFTASGSDPEGEPLSYDWDFGEDGLAQFIVGCPRERTASGAVVRHEYCGTGTANVRLSIRDGLTATEVRQTVEARSLEGRWQPTSALPRPVSAIEFTSGRRTLFGRAAFPGFEGSISGSATHPRHVVFSLWEAPLPAHAGCMMRFEGDVDGSLNRMSGTLTCDTSPECGTCSGQTFSVTFSR